MRAHFSQLFFGSISHLSSALLQDRSDKGAERVLASVWRLFCSNDDHVARNITPVSTNLLFIPTSVSV